MSSWLGNVIGGLTGTGTPSGDPQKPGGCHIYAIVVMHHYAAKEARRLTAEYDFSPLPMYMARISREVTDLVSRTCAQEATPDESKGVEMENKMGTFYVKATNDRPPKQLVFIVAVNRFCTRFQALQFLSEAIRIYKAPPNTMQLKDNVGEALKDPQLRNLMMSYKGRRDVLVDAQSKLDETKQIVMDTLDGLVARQGNLDELIAKSQDMTASTARLMRKMENTSPSAYIATISRKRVLVKLYDGSELRGILATIDDRMNIALEDAQEYLESALIKTYGDVFIRGNNVLYISRELSTE
ncbi:bifunctional LSM domain superfamily/LSM domain [Babesia duncani]|uniref:Bifunctional LSM domain superfamily/LSM domain n=1 Tax=Babesia duncani TaxID=323732 RepID=A0AAD9PM07_9APIC|nr:bifunctional LSM domain superfamily/LSM domain [Babesia duncani]